MGNFTFRKDEKLTKEKSIQELFTKGSSFYLFPFKVFFQSFPEENLKAKVLISVSKKHFKRAVDRNLIKRRIREAYRLQKELIPQNKGFRLAFVYVHKEILIFEEIKKKLAVCMTRVGKS